jgi:succinoglycan biosynthesis protein ExoW
MISAGPQPQPAARIGVVIPYFQQDSGLLNRALASVAAQDHRPVQVIVIDDGSPRPAADEITPEVSDALAGLTVVRHANQGVAAARNAGLDALAADVSAIALLDSDDYWLPSHLQRAAAALALGADFYFSNSLTEGAATDYFHARPQYDLLRNSESVHSAPGILGWRHSVPALFAGGCPFKTSTVVFRRGVMPNLRFSTKFRRAGEDHAAFWELLTRSSVVMFSIEPTLVSGTGGVGIWRNSTFGSPTNLVRLADELRGLREVVNSPLLSCDDRRLMRSAITARRHTALVSALHMLRRGRNVFAELFYLFRADPLCAASWCVDLPKLLYTRIRARAVTAGPG